MKANINKMVIFKNLASLTRQLLLQMKISIPQALIKSPFGIYRIIKRVTYKSLTRKTDYSRPCENK